MAHKYSYIFSAVLFFAIFAASCPRRRLSGER